MTLPPSQQHALDAIDDVLQSAEPRLATMFGVFTDLTRLDSMPAAETLLPEPWWARYRLPGLRFRAGRHQSRPGRRYRHAHRYQHGRRRGRHLVRIVLVPLLLIAAASLLIVSLVSNGAGGRRGCGQAVAAVMASRLRSAVSDSAGSGGTGCTSVGVQPTGGTR
jgi:hypothetical protein